MTTRRRWTEEEDKLLVQAITANPANIRKALMQVSKTLNRTYSACNFRWYRVVSLTQNLFLSSNLSPRKNTVLLSRVNR